MKSLTEIIKQQHAARQPTDDSLLESLLAEIVSLAEENCVLRDRLDTCQRLAAQGDSADDQAIDMYAVDGALVTARLAAHEELFTALFSRLNNGSVT